MRSKADAETLNRLKYAGCPDLEGNLLRMTADFAFRVEYAGALEESRIPKSRKAPEFVNCFVVYGGRDR